MLVWVTLGLLLEILENPLSRNIALGFGRARGLFAKKKVTHNKLDRVFKSGGDFFVSRNYMDFLVVYHEVNSVML